MHKLNVSLLLAVKSAFRVVVGPGNDEVLVQNSLSSHWYLPSRARNIYDLIVVTIVNRLYLSVVAKRRFFW